MEGKEGQAFQGLPLTAWRMQPEGTRGKEGAAVAGRR
jgi:hypothetical protein